MALASPAVVVRRVRLAIPRVDERWIVCPAALACIPLSFLVYWPRINDFFVFDDYFYLSAVRNHAFPSAMVRAFQFTKYAAFDPATPFWRPLIDVYFYTMKPIGLHSQPYHGVNFLLHGAVGGLGVVFLYRLTRAPVTAVSTGLLFVVAPTYDFAVSWIAQISELLGYALMLTALISYHAYLTREKYLPIYAIGTTVATFFALLTKESTVILAVLLPGLVVALGSQNRRSRAQLVGALAVPLAMTVVMAIVINIADTQSNQTVGLHMARNLWRYVKWMVLPYQSNDFGHTREALAALFVLVGVVSIVARQRVLAFLFVWTIVSIVPFTAFDEFVEYRYAYLATLPFIAIVVFLVESLISYAPSVAKAGSYAALVALVVLALIVAPMRTRDTQAGVAFQARQSELMVDSVRNLCGPLPVEARVWVLGSPLIDGYKVGVPSALNLYYERVHAIAVPELPGLAAFVEDKCVIQYDAATETYTRVG